MTRSKCIIATLIAVLVVGSASAQEASAQEGSAQKGSAQEVTRPNILWISCEDISLRLGCYGDPQAKTPTLDALADEGVRYTQAFTCHGVCAPSRTGIITGVYPISLGANHMRSKLNLPKHVKCFPQYLRENGYYTCNNSKTDYNFRWKRKDVWDESSKQAHWRKRPNPEQPFFAVFNLTVTHESRVWPENHAKDTAKLSPELRHQPQDTPVPPIYPPTDQVKGALARLADLTTVMDQQAGEILKQLEEDGLADSTIVFFWSDHGDGLPRMKRTVLDSGTLVPMIVRIPEAFRVDGQGRPGSTSDQLISLIDLCPTVLKLAGVPLPDYLQSQPFLGEDLPQPREFIYTARDRIDARTSMKRAVRDRQYRYVRNYMPWRPALPLVSYGERSAICQALRSAAVDGTLPAGAVEFMRPQQAFEELYDLTADPWETRNVIAEPAQAAKLAELRHAMDRWEMDVRDAHLIPEPLLAAEEAQVGNRWDILHGVQGQTRCRHLLTVASMAGRGDIADLSQLVAASQDADPAIRWWAYIGLSLQPEPGAVFERIANDGLQDDAPVVRLAAARLSAKLGRMEAAIAAFKAGLEDPDQFVRHMASELIADFGEQMTALCPAIEKQLQQETYDHVKDVAGRYRDDWCGGTTSGGSGSDVP